MENNQVIQYDLETLRNQYEKLKRQLGEKYSALRENKILVDRKVHDKEMKIKYLEARQGIDYKNFEKIYIDPIQSKVKLIFIFNKKDERNH
jgi:hypothetical protein